MPGGALRGQKQVFQRTERALKKEEYRRLLDAAEQVGKRRLFLLMDTICATGIRVSEVEYVTVEAARADIQLKGEIRTILSAGEAVPDPVEIRPKTKDRFRQDISRQKRNAAVTEADMGGDEGSVRKGQGTAQQDVSP